ncbi:coiled-coil domain-containing protein 91 isoform X3 [Hemicordylus capensis]|uniref:coiled-coil domain-containing protein 91 isoform X3 n=1 Tax=Hemicordylus capensis TaxID=884348 RepID=UPI0023040ED6|nr:coiled-coil domain-containing protein 91 isoform X3 [Hemicordylus capensis]
MDDDEFGGFEAAEAFEGGNGEPQATSPAIPWAAFPTVSEVHIHQAVSTDVFQEQPSTSVCFVSSDPSNSSGDDILTDGQPSSSTLHLTDHKEQELEDLLNKYRMLETDFLKDKEEELISHQDRYNKLQEKHKLELEDMRRAGHEALTIIVEEFKALLQSTVQQREEAIEKQYVSAVEKQAYKCEEMLIAQHQRLLDMLDKERKMLEEKMEESMLERSQEFKEMLEKYMANERESNKEALAAAAKVEKENMQAAILTAVKAERENMEKLHAVEKEVWQAEQNKDREKVAQAIQDAIQEQRQNSQAIIQAAIMEEQKKSEKAIEEAVKQAREELMEYIKEQKRLDQVIRQRSLSSLELFLSCAQKQLSSLLQEEPTTTEAEQKKMPL